VPCLLAAISNALAAGEAVVPDPDRGLSRTMVETMSHKIQKISRQLEALFLKFGEALANGIVLDGAADRADLVWGRLLKELDAVDRAELLESL
jgi:hypothetical protein